MRSIHVISSTLPEAWESAVLQTWNQGENFRTEYDKQDNQGNYIDPESRDVTATIHVKEPFAEPRIHKAIPAGLEDLEKYSAEVLYGVHNHWVNPVEGKWQYTYHQRLREYHVPSIGKLDQLQEVVEKLKQAPHTRRAQAVTWKAWEDQRIDDPACLQRLWFRVENKKLNMVAHMRSNDAYKAAFMNMFAFTELQKEIAQQIGISPGEYVHSADSFHIYGSYFNEFKDFLKLQKNRPDLEDRTFTTEDAIPMFLDGINTLLSETDMPGEKKLDLLARKAVLELF